MFLRERFLLELAGAVEAYNWAHDNIADLELCADSAGGSCGDHQLRPHLLDDLTPHVDVRQLRAVLRHVRIRLEYDDRFLFDGRGPICAQAPCFEGRAALAHLLGNRREVVQVGYVVVAGILARSEDATECMALVDGPGHHKHVRMRQRAAAAPRGLSAHLRRQSPGPRDVGEAREARCRAKGQELQAGGRFGIEIYDLALEVIERRLFRGRRCRIFEGFDGRRI